MSDDGHTYTFGPPAGGWPTFKPTCNRIGNGHRFGSKICPECPEPKDDNEADS